MGLALVLGWLEIVSVGLVRNRVGLGLVWGCVGLPSVQSGLEWFLRWSGFGIRGLRQVPPPPPNVPEASLGPKGDSTVRIHWQG